MPKDHSGRLIYGAWPVLRLAIVILAALFFSQGLAAAARAAEPIRAVRVWPAPDYTRLTLESAEPLRYNLLTLKNPERLVLDLEDVEPERVQELLAGKVLPVDPYIGAARVGRFKPGVARLVLDL